MSNDEKIEVAEKRILELETLIKHWRSGDIASRNSPVEIVEAILSTRTAA